MSLNNKYGSTSVTGRSIGFMKFNSGVVIHMLVWSGLVHQIFYLQDCLKDIEHLKFDKHHLP